MADRQEDRKDDLSDADLKLLDEIGGVDAEGDPAPIRTSKPKSPKPPESTPDSDLDDDAFLDSILNAEPEPERTVLGQIKEAPSAFVRGTGTAASETLKGTALDVERMRRKAGSARRSVQNTPLFKAGEELAESTREAFPAQEGYEDTLWTQAFEGAGSMGAYGVAGLLGRGVGLRGAGQYAIPTGMAQASGQSAVHRDLTDWASENPESARELGLDEDAILQFSQKGAPTGAIEVASVVSMLRPLTGKLRQQVVRRMIETGFNEYTVENLGEAGRNLIKKEYDPDHPLWDNVPESGEPAAIGAMLMALVFSPFTRGDGPSGGRTDVDGSLTEEEREEVERIQRGADALDEAGVDASTLFGEDVSPDEAIEMLAAGFTHTETPGSEGGAPVQPAQPGTAEPSASEAQNFGLQGLGVPAPQAAPAGFQNAPQAAPTGEPSATPSAAPQPPQATPPAPSQAPQATPEPTPEVDLGVEPDTLRYMAERAGWVERRGRPIRDPKTEKVIGRTRWIPQEPWFKWEMASDERLAGDAARNAVEKALKGTKLKAKERRFVDRLVEIAKQQAQATREAFEEVEADPDHVLTPEDFESSGTPGAPQDSDIVLPGEGIPQEEITDAELDEIFAPVAGDSTEQGPPAEDAPPIEAYESEGQGAGIESGPPEEPLSSYTQEELNRRAAEEREAANREAERQERIRQQEQIGDFQLESDTGSVEGQSDVEDVTGRPTGDMFANTARSRGETPQGESAQGQAPQGETQEAQPSEGSKNTIFTEDAAEKAREVLRRKLGQLNAGVDPEIMQAGITLAGYHIEKGARSFSAYARAMVADMGESVKPYLKSWYMGVKFDPRAASFEGMDSSSDVESADVDAVLKQEQTNAQEVRADEGQPQESGSQRQEGQADRSGDVQQESQTGAEAGNAQEGLIFKKDGAPFQTERAALLARNRADLKDRKDQLEAVEVKGGWALRAIRAESSAESAESSAETEAAPAQTEVTGAARFGTGRGLTATGTGSLSGLTTASPRGLQKFEQHKFRGTEPPTEPQLRVTEATNARGEPITLVTVTHPARDATNRQGFVGAAVAVPSGTTREQISQDVLDSLYAEAEQALQESRESDVQTAVQAGYGASEGLIFKKDGAESAESSAETDESEQEPASTRSKPAESEQETGDTLTGKRKATGKVDKAAAAADRNPSDAQIEAGNYEKGHVSLHGLDISIENPKGSTRSGIDPDGNEWSVTMGSHYGYVKRSEGVDGEQVDVFLGPQAEDPNLSVFIIDQKDQKTGKFDEHKVMLGFPDRKAAESAYRRNYEKGWKVGPVTEMSLDEFKKWIREGDNSWPAVEYAYDNEAALNDISGSFDTFQDREIPDRWNQEEEWDVPVAHFPKPEKTVSANQEAGPKISPDEAKRRMDEWRAEARRMGREQDNSDKVVISMFDESGEISKPWREAGFTVYQYDIKLGDDLMEHFPMADLNEIKSEGKKVVGVIAQPPCTCFSSSGARWWATRHDADDREMVNNMFGHRAARYFSRPLDYTRALVSLTDLVIGFSKDLGGLQFWALENPVGRVAKETGLPDPTLRFDPHVYGDPYTKKTQIWGQFNTDLPTANVEPTQGSLMHKLWSTSEKEGGDRSLTPEGFAYAFFMANKDAAAGAVVDAQTESETASMVEKTRKLIQSGERLGTIREARQAMAKIIGKPVLPGSKVAKQAEELLEAAAVEEASDIASRALDAQDAFRRIRQLQERLPNLSSRTSTSVAQQAYSTPLTISYVASQLADVSGAKSVYESSAGHGALLMETHRKQQVSANELNEGRADRLRAVLPHANVTTHNALQHDPGKKKFDVVIANPPFGRVRGENGKTETFNVNGLPTSEVDHAIVLSSLEAMKDDGRAVFIIGGTKGKNAAAREAQYRARAKMAFFDNLYNHYNVTAHATLAGNLYSQQGASFPVDLIVIEGRGKSKLKVPGSEAPPLITTLDELGGILDDRSVLVPEVRTINGTEARSDQSTEGGEAERGRLHVPPRAQGSGDDRSAAGSGESGKGRGSGTGGGRSDAGAGARDDGSGGQPDRGQSQTAGLHEVEGRSGNRVRNDSGADARGGKSVQGRDAGGVSGADQAVESTSGHQIDYTPKSSAWSIGMLVPVNLRSATMNALERMAYRRGSVDRFVAWKLGYDPDRIGDYFAAEQVDALALALDNFDAGKGFIIGDQTGAGKGRVVAGIIRYARMNNLTPIFVTEKPNLYSDMYRDLKAIGSGGLKPLMTNAGEKVVLDEDSGKTLKTPAAKKHNAHLQEVAQQEDLGGYDVVFTTYSQMQRESGNTTPRMHFLESVSDGGVLIMDESHNAGGQGAGADQDGETRASFARSLAAKAQSVMYSSATYAKRANVMDLYFRTNMSLAVNDMADLVAAIEAGGVPLQQVTAATLAAEGQYIRRERTFEGVTYETSPVPVKKAQAEGVSGIMSGVHKFDSIKNKAVKRVQKEAAQAAKTIGVDPSVGEAGMRSTNFTSLMHNLIDQMLLSLKAEATVEKAKKALKDGRKPVIALSNTMESFVKSYAEMEGLSKGDAVDLSFGDLLHRYLQRSRYVREKNLDGTVQYRWLDDETLGPAAVRQYKEVESMIETVDLSDMPISPIDYIRSRLEQEGIHTGEVTGRTMVIDYSGDTPSLATRPTKETDIDGRRQMVSDFNNGKIDAIILNQSGSTGISLHSSEDFKDTRQRHMIIAQAEKNIDTHMQMLGRIHRTGQMIAPYYEQMVADIPAEKRPASVLAKKMASLNANTTASRGSDFTAKEVPDFMNEYGDQVAQQIMADNPEWNKALGGPVKETSGAPEPGTIAKVTGRIPLLPLEQQEQLYSILEAEYKDLIQQLEAAGASPLEAKTLSLDARTLESTVVYKGNPEVDSLFAADAVAETVDIKRIGTPMKWSEITEALQKATDESTENPKDLLKAGRDKVNRLHKEALSEFEAYSQEIVDNASTPEAGAKLKENLEGQRLRIEGVLRGAAIGSPVKVNTDDGAMEGIVLDVERRGKTSSPMAPSDWRVTVALADPRRQATFSFSRMMGDNALVEIKPSRRRLEDMDQVFRDAAGKSREQRVIVTGNILAGFAEFQSGSIINFTDAQGETRQGILMPRRFDLKTRLDAKPVTFSEPMFVKTFLDGGRDRLVQSKDGRFKVRHGRGDSYQVEVPASKKQGAEFFLNREILEAAGEEFVKSGSDMLLRVEPSKLEAVLNAVSGKVTLVTHAHKDEAAKITGRAEEFGVQETSEDRYDRMQQRSERDPYEQAHTRPGTTEAQKELGRGAIRDLFRQLTARFNRWASHPDSRGTISVLGAEVYENFVAGEPNQLVGKTIQSPHDLAALAQVYRDPRFETFRVVFMREGRVVGEYGQSSRLPGVVQFTPNIITEIQYQKQALDADSFYMLHNHPSGNPKPSLADSRVTERIDQDIPGFQGHVVLDHNEYGWIPPWVPGVREDRADVVSAPDLQSADLKSRPEVPHSALGTPIKNAADLVSLGKQIEDRGRDVVVVATNARGGVNLITSFPQGMMNAIQARLEEGSESRQTEALAALRRVRRASGAAGKVFAIVPESNITDYTWAMDIGLFTDVVSLNGDSLTQNPRFLPRTPIRGHANVEGASRTVEVRETADGPRYRMGQQEPEGSALSVEDVEAAARGFFGKIGDAPKIKVRASEREFPDGLKERIKAEKATGRVEAAYWQGSIWIAADRMDSADTVHRTILHEAAHVGLRKLFGSDGMGKVLNRVWLMHGQSHHRVQAIIKQYFGAGEFNPNNRDHRDLVAEELIAKMAETGSHPTIVQEALAAIRKWIRRLGVDLQMNEADLSVLIRQSREAALHGGLSIVDQKARASRGDAETIDVDGKQRPVRNSEGDRIHRDDESLRKFWRWFGNSQAVDEQGRPKVVFHGTPTGGFTVFDTSRRDTKGGHSRGGFSFTTNLDAASAYAEGFAEDVNSLDNTIHAVNKVFRSVWDHASRKQREQITEELGSSAADEAPEWSWQVIDSLDEAIDGAHHAASVLEDAGLPESAQTMRDVALSAESFVSEPGVYEAYLKVPQGVPVYEASPESLGEVVAGLDVRNVTGKAAVVNMPNGEQVFYVAEPNQIKSATENQGTFDPESEDIRFSLTDPKKFKGESSENSGPVLERHARAQRSLFAGQPVDGIFRFLFSIGGQVDSAGRWKPGVKLSNAVKKAILEWKPRKNGVFGWMNPALESARAGVIDRFGLSEAFIQREFESQAEQATIEGLGEQFVRNLGEAGVGIQEAKVLQDILTNEDVGPENLRQLSEPIRATIDEFGQQLVDLGFLRGEDYQRHLGSYMHRSYLKYEQQQDGLPKWAQQAMKRHRRKIQGDELKARGLKEDVTMKRLLRDVPQDWWGRKMRKGEADAQLVNTEWRLLDLVRIEGEGSHTLGGIDAGKAKGKVLKRVWWPADKEVPSSLAEYTDRGVWKVTGSANMGKLRLRRDFTKAERESMGEILDARYNIIRTFQLMSHDIANGKFFRDIAQNPEWAVKKPEGEDVVAKPSDARRMRTFAEADWVEVPNTKIAGTNAHYWGALAGMYVRPAIWRDLNELDKMQQQGTWRSVLNQWKVNKTARSPVVHMNNVMSNFILMDLIDVRMQDLVRGINEYRNRGDLYILARDNGAFGAGFVRKELNRNVVDPILDEIMEEMRNERDSVEGRTRALSKMGYKLWELAKKGDRKMVDFYQTEDELFRMATFMRHLSMGATPQEAAQIARDQFLNYDIRAPWVNAARATVIPFISYTYRAVPAISQAIMHRPWKLAKYITMGYLANLLAYELAPGDEDEERRTMRERQQGTTWASIPFTDIGIHRMMRLPWKDSHNNPMFIDVFRWIPAGDVFDTNQGQIGLPAWLQFGGPLQLAFEMTLNRSGFTGEDIVNREIATTGEAAKARLDYLYKAWMPSAAYVPGSWHSEKLWSALQGERDILDRPYSVPAALASGVGVKVQPHDVQLGYFFRDSEIQRKVRALKAEARQILRDADRGIGSESKRRSDLNRIREKIRHMEKESRRLHGRD